MKNLVINIVVFFFFSSAILRACECSVLLDCKILGLATSADPRGVPSQYRWQLKCEISAETALKLGLKEREICIYLKSPVRTLGRGYRGLVGKHVLLELEGEIEKQFFGKVKLLRGKGKQRGAVREK